MYVCMYVCVCMYVYIYVYIIPSVIQTTTTTTTTTTTITTTNYYYYYYCKVKYWSNFSPKLSGPHPDPNYRCSNYAGPTVQATSFVYYCEQCYKSMKAPLSR
jgi:hypothetical protein